MAAAAPSSPQRNTPGVAPVVGYHHGAGSRDELKGLLRRSAVLIGSFSVAMCLAGEGLGRPLAVWP